MKISKSLSVATDKTSGAITLRFEDEHGVMQTINIPPEAADHLSMALLSSPSAHRPDGKTKVLRYLNTLGSETAIDEKGNFRLSFRLSETAFVHLSVPREAIPILQNQLSQVVSGDTPSFH